MTATLEQPDGATGATSAWSLLDFDVIKERAGAILGIAPSEVTDGTLGEMFGLDRGTILRYRWGHMKPRFETVSEMADVLGLSVDDIRAKGNPSPPRPAAPRPAPRPAGPPKGGE